MWREPLECAGLTALWLSGDAASVRNRVWFAPVRKAKAGSSPRTPKPRGTHALLAMEESIRALLDTEDRRDACPAPFPKNK